MAFRTTVTGFVLIGALSTLPVFAEAGQRQRGGSDRQDRQGGRTSGQAQARSESRQRGESAAPQSQNESRQNGNVQRQQQSPPSQYQGQQSSAGRQYQSQPQRQYQSQPQRQYQSQSQQHYQSQSQQHYQSQRPYAVPRQYAAPHYSYNNSRSYYSNRSYGHGSYAYGSYGYRSYGYSGRVIYPTIVTVVPYRPYVYRPHFGIGVYYGTGGSYAYGVTPPVYYNPQPGGYYGGLRITGAPRDAQVFADGYYVGIVDDFDGVFQHVNLEAGRHHIEIQSQGYQAVEFDVDVQPGRTTTFRADVH